MTAEQIGQLFSIRIVPYNSEWKVLFEQEKALLTAVFGEGFAFNIEHYDHLMYDGDIQLIDMIYLKKDL